MTLKLAKCTLVGLTLGLKLGLKRGVRPDASLA